jgi:hypothetical protein
MSSQSAIQVISPAIERTKQFLFKPFRLGRFFKLTLVAALTEGASGGLNLGGNFPSGKTEMPKVPKTMPHIEWPQIQHWLLFGAVALVVVLAISILVSYLLIRLRFSYFDCVLREQDQIGPAWDIYHRQAVRYLGLTLLIGLGFWVALIPIGYAIYEHFKPLFALMVSGQTADLWTFVPLIATVVPVFLLLALIAGLIHLALTCFVLPRMALEDASIGDALSDVWSDVRMEPGQFFVFALFRFLLGIAGSLIGTFLLILPFLVVVGIGVVIVLIAKAVSTALAFVVGIPLAILIIGLFIVAAIGVGGTMGTFQRNYALLFYGGRYPLLGSMLPPPPPPRVWQPAYAPPPNPAPGV